MVIFVQKKIRRRQAAAMLLHVHEFYVEDERGKCGDSAADAARAVAEGGGHDEAADFALVHCGDAFLKTGDRFARAQLESERLSARV